MTKLGVKIMPRKVILDSQGRAVEQTLKLNQMNVQHVRVGKFIELEFQQNKNDALIEARRIAEKVLSNPLIETFEIVEME